jgi:hypothetical protein
LSFPPLLKNIGLQVRALAVGRKTEMLATSDSIGVVNLWIDSSAVDKELFLKVVSKLIAHSLCSHSMNEG